MICKNCLNNDRVHSVMACNECGLVVDDNMFVNETITRTNNLCVDIIRSKMNTILNECLPLFNLHKNVEKVLKKRMVNILKSNKDIGKLKNVESIVFTLLIYAIRDMRIPINKNRLNEKIKQYISMNLMLKELNNIKL